MTVSTTTSRADYTGDGTTTVYPYNFLVFAATDLAVYVAGVLQVFTTNYVVSNVGVATGGNVTFLVAPVVGAAVAIVRSVPTTQLSAYPYGGPFPEKVTETALDKLTVLDQQGLELAGRSFAFKPASTFKNLPVDDPVASAFLQAKSDLSGFAWALLTASGTYVNPITTLGDLLRGGTAGAVERLGIGTSGQRLTADPISGKPEWRAGSIAVLTNQTGGTHVIGDVVALDSANDSSVRADDTQASLSTFVVALTTNATGTVGVYARSGLIANVKAQGAIARYQYVRKSATSRAVEDAGVTASATVLPPPGTMGIALTAAAASLVTLYLFDATWPMPQLTVKGDLYAATAANTPARVPASTCSNVVLLADTTQPGNMRWSTLPFAGAASFTSADQTVTLSSVLLVPHGFGAKPSFVQVTLKNTTTELSYPTGDEVAMNGGAGNGVNVSVDTTNVYIISAANIAVLNKSTFVSANIVAANWRFVVRAWK